MAGRLESKIAIVTGAGTGIGEAIAHKFAREGAKVVAAGLPDDPVDDVVRAIRERGGVAESFLGDLADEVDAQACVALAADAFGKIDILVNNAGVFPEIAECQDHSVEMFDYVVRNNIRSAFLMTKFALPHLRRSHGVVISTGSEAGEMGEPMAAPYGGSKGFLHAFMRSVAYEQGKYGVRALCVCPGPIDTAWTHKETGLMDAQMEKQTLAGTVLGRRGTPEEMANVFAFAASDEASFLTGTLIFADGGTTIAKGGPGEMAKSFVREQPKPTLDLKHSHDGLKGKPVENRMH
ncbi:SDR family NAD(P)-dependent oxidoreductase [Bradyrhizobium valentinum]|uniref:Short-chain dehydrogenase n=1 Tax=Bradyrhizobium valentinum TaxID=1518501 RepID=A0A0R3LDC7_9BRAD|nr:SDR family oxidoreductase [Bradyrhizobium valentinum]KRR05844.1 short-chain dehydrogenase [Bradyrhizobium valentinum]KRR07099.1 short-chain dehydrogenase [Bradyrhizobium valentinum]